MIICNENNLWDKKLPQVRKQCWEEITSQYNAQQGTNFTKSQVVHRYKNYKAQLKMEKSHDGVENASNHTSQWEMDQSSEIEDTMVKKPKKVKSLGAKHKVGLLKLLD